jgi:predicted Zn-dependent protease
VTLVNETIMRRFLGRILRRPLTIMLLVAVALAAAGLIAWQRWQTAQHLRQGEQALEEHEYSKAREHLTRYLRSRPEDVRVRLLAARAARWAREYDEASAHLHRCLRDGASADVVAIESALLAVQQGEERQVAWLRQRALEDNELSLVILEVLIEHDVDSYQLRLALDELARYLARKPDDLMARLGRGRVWERFQSYTDALDDYRAAVLAHPDSEDARLHLAETLLIVGTPGEALEHYQWLAPRRPNQPNVRLGLARCQRWLGHDVEARQMLDELLAEAPDNVPVLWERGQVAFEQGRAAEAEPWLRRAVEGRPYDRQISYSLYRCLQELGRLAEADTVRARVSQMDADVRRLGQLHQEIIKRPDDANLRCEGGLLFLRNGERDAGVRWLQMALRLDPRCDAARSALATANAPPPP